MNQNSPPLTVLIVEDQPEVAQSTAELLALHGYTVRLADSGPVALREATVAPPDVILLDIGLPVMDGWEVARRLRAQIIGRQPLIVAVTARGTDSDRWRSAGSGFDQHLVKPVEPSVLIALLQRIANALRPA